MDFEREKLKEALDVAKLAIDQREFIPILSHFCFSGKMITTYNDMIGIQVAFKTNFVCALQANVLLRLIDSVSSKNIAIGFGDKTVYFKSGLPRKGVRARLPFMGEDDFFFKLPNMKRLDTFSLSEKQAGSFFNGLKLCLSSVGDQQPIQMGVTLTGIKSNMFLYSTNNKAISRYVMKLSLECFKDDILPTSFCNAVIKASEIYGTDNVSVSKGKEFVIITFGDRCKVYGKLIRNKDPLDFEKVVKQHLPENYKGSKQKLGKDFSESFQRALIILGAEISKLTLVTIDWKVVTVEARSSAGKLKSSSEFRKTFGKGFLNGEFRVDAELALKALENADYVCFGKNSIIFSKGSYMHLLSATPVES